MAIVGLVSLPAGAALAQTINTDLPPLGTTDVRLGDLRNYLDQTAPGFNRLAAPGWTITPGIDVTQAYQSNGGSSSGSNGRGTQAFTTTVAPSIAVTGESRRLSGNFFYSPQVVLSDDGNSSTYIAQDFNGSGHAILVPETLFLDASAYGFLQSYFSNATQNTVINPYQNNQVPTYTFNVSPYLQHRFGGDGVAEIGYAAQYSTFGSVQNSTIPGFIPGTVVTNPNATISNSSLLSNSEHVAFTTGENFGRFNGTAQAVATQDSGSPLYQGAHSETELLELGYALNRFVTPIATIGYESIAYPNAQPPVRIDDLVWAG
ncbi:MAG: hypothetical protein JO326_11990, partial [Acetobacteraceae bacterium]|nr:hypothetical protein [Acetobacteraceae bacterium]